MADRDLSLTAAMFHIVKENVLTNDPLDSTRSVAAGEVRSRGFDINGRQHHPAVACDRRLCLCRCRSHRKHQRQHAVRVSPG